MIMELSTIEMPKEQAEERLKAYKAMLATERTDQDRRIERGYGHRTRSDDHQAIKTIKRRGTSMMATQARDRARRLAGLLGQRNGRGTTVMELRLFHRETDSGI